MDDQELRARLSAGGGTIGSDLGAYCQRLGEVVVRLQELQQATPLVFPEDKDVQAFNESLAQAEAIMDATWQRGASMFFA